MSKKRILSGMQPSGLLHLGNYFGALKNWVSLQDDYECFYFIADWHSLTTLHENPREIPRFTREVAIDWLAAGLDPEKCTLFVQSRIPEHAELHLILSMIVPVSWLERNPTYKEKQQEVKTVDMSSYGFLGYPVLQTADIVLYNAHYVPVGIDQAPHLELSREIVRRFQHFYKKKVLIEPEAKISEVPKLNGIDGRKMSKSYNNAIYLSDSEKEITKKIQSMLTDPQRLRRNDPGDPDVCNLFPFHKLFSSEEKQAYVDENCRTAGIGCGDCKALLAESMLAGMRPLMERRAELVAKPKEVDEILDEGTERARKVAENTMRKVKEAMKLK
ncbi:Tryptophanyl-tRNA synthetase [Nitrospina gracilis 3/211]|uniref:Tryptophan--tRNA ligase n=1 Tax=Nitrospina gracilis (strain 3/211) TaxID=1266370 RepID=M1Z1C1_NITG3|nr:MULTISPECIES: tryptophan--tRNA ligase [Nitrospina]MCF8724153.1 tryptophanyl-tRNA synthetase [Nitrospina sp. Nb-3]CCQ91299.1 Tryptophanyl-tRNA synthetase [Nitrospina gracilis 3/211]